VVGSSFILQMEKMMDKIKKILAIFEPERKNHPALLRAVEFAKKYGNELVVLSVVYDNYTDFDSLFDNEFQNQYQQFQIKKTEQQLSEIVEELKSDDLNISYRVVWSQSSVQAINHLVHEEDYGLLFKSTSPHHKFKDLIFTPNDWNILRHSAVPVMMVKEKNWLQRGPILVAVDTSSHDDAHLALNRNLLRHAVFLAKDLGRKLHILHVYPFPIMQMPVEYSSINYEEIQKNTEARHRAKMEEMLKLFDLPDYAIDLVPGLADEAIIEIAENIDAHLLVMGTVARSGMNAAILGNTVEHTIDRVDCDVLTIKPVQYIDFLLQNEINK